MHVIGFDERNLVHEGLAANFVVFIYEGGDAANHSWSVESLLLTDADVPEALHWLRENLPANSCWSLGIVLEPLAPTPETDLSIRWIVGADVLNMQANHRSSAEEQLAQEMLQRRDRVDLL